MTPAAGRLVLMAIAVLFIGACGGPQHPSSHKTGNEKGCDYVSTASQPELGGPIKGSNRPYIRERSGRAGTLQFVPVFPIVNKGAATVRLLGVVLPPDPGTSELRFGGAYVVPAAKANKVAQGMKPKDRWELQAKHCLKPVIGKHAPILVLQIGPSPADQAGGFDYSRNNNINLLYRTPDGKTHAAVWAYRIQYPNKTS